MRLPVLTFLIGVVTFTISVEKKSMIYVQLPLFAIEPPLIRGSDPKLTRRGPRGGARPIFDEPYSATMRLQLRLGKFCDYG